MVVFFWFFFAAWINVIHSLHSDYVISNDFLTNLETLRTSSNPTAQLLFPQGNIRFLIIFVENFGLGNRLRTIADWYVISLVTNRRLIVSWKPSVECNITFPDMFESVPSSVYFLDQPFLEMNPDNFRIASLQRILSEQGISNRFIHGDEFPYMYDIGFLVKKEIFLDPTLQVVATQYDGLLSLEDVPCHYYQDKRRYFLSNLRPRTEFTEAVQQVLTHFSGVLPVGVHIRISDPMYDWAVVPPLEGGNKAKEFDESAKLEDFINLMHQINEYFQFDFPNVSSPSLPQKSLVKFFIASNSPHVKEIISNIFSDRVIFLNFPAASRNTVEGMKQAFLEWLLLSEMSLVVNTYGSSFAMEATQRRNIPLVGVYEGYYVHQISETLPFCGNLQFGRLFSRKAQRTRFTEGTFDNREVLGVALSFSQCDNLQNFGIPNAYCVQAG